MVDWTVDIWGDAKANPSSARSTSSLIVADGMIVIRTNNLGGYPYACKIWTWNATTGQLICEGPDLGYYSGAPENLAYFDGKVFIHSDDMHVYAIDVYTGKLAWASEQEYAPLAAFGRYGGLTVAYGYVYSGSWDGYLRCLDAKTGKTVWKYFCGNSSETGMGVYVPFGLTAVADGKVYQVTGEHTPPNPEPMGNKLYCLDAYTGKLIWSYPFMCVGSASQGAGISSGMYWCNNEYDGCLYMFGKGQTETTVSVGPKTIANGASVLIEGTVTDQSSGSKDTPAISD